jgi:uncharacterized protein (TIGR04255 family)
VVWNASKPVVETFVRNPLILVVAEAKFEPLLKLDQRVADVQDTLRGLFPRYQRAPIKMVDLAANGMLSVLEGTVHTFTSSDGATTLNLSNTSLSLQTRDYRDRAQFADTLKAGWDALNAVIPGVVPTRLGLRYVNELVLAIISTDMNRQMTWPDLLDGTLLARPLGHTPGAFVQCEIRDATSNGGHLTFRFANLPDGKFRLDYDRFDEGAFEPNDLFAKLSNFADDIYGLFMDSITSGTLDWMKKT